MDILYKRHHRNIFTLRNLRNSYCGKHRHTSIHSGSLSDITSTVSPTSNDSADLPKPGDGEPLYDDVVFRTLEVAKRQIKGDKKFNKKNAIQPEM